ncbi:hypothetical protein E2C01_100084 [Portunus trituberculatus]|uniref:Uncharacterized protein n=1 Tax=Portunus trituberculatus TaxID=210409 RepID=A0A5B7KGH8_PORTR|nr:hypothetical protein [Portunus trituberculatus]
MSRTGQGGQGMVGQGRAGQGRAGQGRAGQDVLRYNLPFWYDPWAGRCVTRSKVERSRRAQYSRMCFKIRLRSFCC